MHDWIILAEKQNYIDAKGMNLKRATVKITKLYQENDFNQTVGVASVVVYSPNERFSMTQDPN